MSFKFNNINIYFISIIEMIRFIFRKISKEIFMKPSSKKKGTKSINLVGQAVLRVNVPAFKFEKAR